MGLPEQYGCHSQYFDLPGLRMHVAIAGPEEGPLLILLHGFPEFWYSWRHQIGPLAQAGFRVVVPDQRGYNLTTKTPPFDIHTLVGDITALMDACGAVSAYVAGHDWGAAVAWGLATLQPERVKRLAILNVPHPAPMFHALTGGNLRQLRRSWYIFFFQIPDLPEWALRRQNYANLHRMMKGSSLPHTFTEIDLTRYQAAWAQPGALYAMIGWYRALLRASFRQNRQLSRTRVHVPTLILWGEKDIALGVELAEQSCDWVDDVQLVRFPNATHWVHEDEAEAVTQALLAHFGAPAANAG